MRKLSLILPVVAFLTIMEVLLRCCHELLPQATSNYIASGYHIGLGGIYTYSPDMHMYVMKPRFQRNMFYNGYHWHHRTDSLGFRNPLERTDVEIILLGDSMIYGHGVEEEDTVRSKLEDVLERPVSNLGMQGSSIHQEYQTLRHYISKFSTRFAFLFFLSNDISELREHLDPTQMQRFIDHEGDAGGITYFEPSPLPSTRRLLALFEGMYTARALFAGARLLWRQLEGVAWADEEWVSASFFSRHPELVIPMRFHLRALTEMHTIAQQYEFHFVNVFIDTDHAVFRDREAIFKKVVREHCLRKGIPFIDLSAALPVDPIERKLAFLPYDGHFSPQGSAWVAKFIADYIESYEADVPQ